MSHTENYRVELEFSKSEHKEPEQRSDNLHILSKPLKHWCLRSVIDTHFMYESICCFMVFAICECDASEDKVKSYKMFPRQMIGR